MAYLTNPLSDTKIKKAKLKEKDCSYFSNDSRIHT